jgi:Flp pilus assembly protein TadD
MSQNINREVALMKSLLCVLALLLNFMLAQTPALADLPAPRSTPENPNIAAGRKAIEAKDYKAAVGPLTKAVQEDPNNADAQNMLGYSYRKLGTFDKSMEHYQKALKIDPNHRSALEYLGELYLEMKQLDNAEKQLANLKKACPFFGKCEEYDDLKAAIDKYKTKK